LAAQTIDEIRLVHPTHHANRLTNPHPRSRSIAKIPTLEPHLRDAAVHSYADALRVVFIAQAVCAFIMLLACLPIRESFLPGTREEQEEQYRRNARNSAAAAGGPRPSGPGEV
jgi:hypothetical protein